MPKRRPTAADRELADTIRRLPVGVHKIEVEVVGDRPFGFGLARLKPEGGAEITLPDKTIYITPGPKP